MLKYLNPFAYYRFLMPKLGALWYARPANLKAVDAHQNSVFADLGLDPVAGEARLNEVLAEVQGRPFDYQLDSIHWLIFACLSRQANTPRRILEIGTFNGKCAHILSRLFPDAEIVTVDLPADDPILRASYGRDEGEVWQHFRAKQAEHLDRPNIRFVEVNSFFLLDRVAGPFDLIWVDAGHRYPEVGWDICHAHHLACPGGIIMCDDVLTSPDAIDDAYVSRDTFKLLSFITERVNSRVTYFLKRRSPAWSGWRRRRKFVAVMRKPG